MEKTTIGPNRTGVEASPIHSVQQLQATQDFPTLFLENGEDPFPRRVSIIQDADPVGSVPLPMTFKGMGEAVLQRFKGKRAEVFIDKLGERLAFERTGARVYEMLMTKYHAFAGTAEVGTVELQRLQEFRDDEAQHFRLLSKVMENIGADPTAETPSADLAGVSGEGPLKIIADPRTTLAQAMEAMLILEKIDEGGWELLIDMAKEVGLGANVGDFENALEQERFHLAQVKQWYEALIMDELKVA